MYNNSSPTISVLMSVYNDMPHLEKAVESILDQTFSDFEFIIVNDGSTDGSLELLKKYVRKDERIKLFDEPNKGLTKELQFALKHVQGEYIARMDGDDIAYPHRFEHQVQFMRANPEIVCSGTNVMFIDEDDDLLAESEQVLEHSQIEKQLFNGRGGAIYHPTMIAKTEAVEKIGGYNEKYRVGQDLDLFFRLAEIGTLANSEKITLKFRRHFKSTTALEEDSAGFRRRKEIIENTLKRRGEYNKEISIEVDPPQTISEYHLSMGFKAACNGYRKNAIKHLVKALKKPVIDKRYLRKIYHILLQLFPLLGKLDKKLRATRN